MSICQFQQALRTLRESQGELGRGERGDFGWYTAGMFQVTEAALDALYKGRVDADHSEGNVMRRISQGEGFGFKLDSAGLTDMVFRHKGQEVLLVASSLNRTMGHMRMDVVSHGGKRSFVLERANQ